MNLAENCQTYKEHEDVGHEKEKTMENQHENDKN